MSERVAAAVAEPKAAPASRGRHAFVVASTHCPSAMCLCVRTVTCGQVQRV